MSRNTPKLTDFRRIVIKVGSSLLVDSAAGRVHEDWLASLAEDHCTTPQGEARHPCGVVGRDRARPRRAQAVAWVAEARGLRKRRLPSARSRSRVPGRRRSGGTAFRPGQILVTLGDTEERRRYLNARSTIAKLLEWRSVPVINENDTVATNEIRYGDNDRLAARVATMASADLLVLLSDVDGLYDAPPQNGANAKLIPLVERITPEIEAMAGASGSELSRGGMQTKIEAGKIATTGGIHMVIASGRVDHPLQVIANNNCTWFLTPANPVTARKKWIAGSLEPKGTLTIDAGAVAALRRGNSLLPVGIVKVEGAFARGDAVIVRGPDGHEIGRGLVAYDAEDAEKIRGKSSADVLLILGIEGRAEMVHRDDLVLGQA